MTSSPADPFAVMRLIDDRSALLRELERRPMEKRDLVEVLGCSRSTVDRAIDRLSTYHLVERREAGYALTFPGRRLLEIYTRHRARVASVTSVSGLLSTLPSDCSLPDELLWDGEIVDGDACEPGRPQRRLVERIAEATAVRLLLPIADTRCLHRLHGRLEDDIATTATVIVDETTLDRLETTVPDLLEGLAERNVLFRTERSLAYGLAVVDGTAIVVLCDDHRRCCGLLHSDADRVLSWADRTLAEHETRACAIHPTPNVR